MGLSFDAFTAGTRPKTMPMTIEKATDTTHAGMLIATGVACIIEIFLARWIWSKTHRAVNNVTLFAMLLGPVAFALLLVVVVLAIFLVQLILGLLGVIVAGAIVFCVCSGG